MRTADFIPAEERLFAVGTLERKQTERQCGEKKERRFDTRVSKYAATAAKNIIFMLDVPTLPVWVKYGCGPAASLARLLPLHLIQCPWRRTG